MWSLYCGCSEITQKAFASKEGAAQTLCIYVPTYQCLNRHAVIRGLASWNSLLTLK